MAQTPRAPCPRTRLRAGRLPPMTSHARSATASEDPFPLVTALDALERWQREPTDERRAAIEATLGGVLETAGARGLVLEICAPPLATLAIGAGTLVDLPGPDRRDGLAVFTLGAHGGHQSLGRLYLDAPQRAVDPIVRGLDV